MNKKIIVVGGGTVYPLDSHISLASIAFGNTARMLSRLFRVAQKTMDVELILTRMASGDEKAPHTFQHMRDLRDKIVADTLAKIVIWSPAMVDFSLNLTTPMDSGRIPSDGIWNAMLVPQEKIVRTFRETRKDMFLVAFKQTEGLTAEQQYAAGLALLKTASANLVVANDNVSRLNMIITPEESTYAVTQDRYAMLEELVGMCLMRSHLTFTRSTVVAGDPVPWSSDLVPPALREVVDYCRKSGAYQEFKGATVGHFAAKLGPTTFLTSIRKSNFNDIDKIGLVRVETDGPDNVVAYGAKPSVGGQSQRLVFSEHPELDCIVHFHCEKKKGSSVPTVSQREFECGSHECGQNTSTGLADMGNGIWAVYLDNHGPNIVFSRETDPALVINFINENFDLNTKTGGFQLPKD